MDWLKAAGIYVAFFLPFWLLANKLDAILQALVGLREDIQEMTK